MTPTAQRCAPKSGTGLRCGGIQRNPQGYSQGVPPPPWTPPRGPLHNHRLASGYLDGAQCSELDYRAHFQRSASRRGYHSRSVNTFGSVDWSTGDLSVGNVASSRLGRCGEWDDWRAGGSVNQPSTSGQPMRPLHPQHHGVRQFRFSFEISEHGSSNVQRGANQVVVAGGSLSVLPMGSPQNGGAGSSHTESIAEARNVARSSRTLVCACFDGGFTRTRLKKVNHSSWKQSEGEEASKGSLQSRLSTQLARVKSKLHSSKKSDQASSSSEKGWKGLSIGKIFRQKLKKQNTESTNMMIPIDTTKLPSLCPSRPGTDNIAFTADGPDASWVDEGFFDCDENWEAILAPLTLRGAGESARLALPSGVDGSKRSKGNDKDGDGAKEDGLWSHEFIGNTEEFAQLSSLNNSISGAEEKGATAASLSAAMATLPGLASIPRADEVGSDVRTIEDLRKMNGLWARDPVESDDPGLLCDVMELPWFYKRALRLANQSQVDVCEEQVSVRPKLFGLVVPTAATPFSRNGNFVPRRDRRKGCSRISLVRTIFGFRQYNCWAEPFAGMSIVEVGLSEDCSTLTMSTFVKRRAGPSCVVRTVFRRLR